MRNMVKAPPDISVEHVFALAADFQEDGLYRIMAAASRSKAVAVCLKARFPFGFQGLFDQRLVGAVAHDRHLHSRLPLYPSHLGNG